jgi:Ca2+-binding RTX toxin-like protein
LKTSWNVEIIRANAFDHVRLTQPLFGRDFMSDLTPQEQLMLELINRARMDPAGEAKRLHLKGGVNEGLDPGTISSAPKQVLAGNDDLGTSAANHSKWMLTNDMFQHEETKGSKGYTGVQPWDRMQAAGYVLGDSGAGENIAWQGTAEKMTDAIATQFIIAEENGLFIDKDIAGRGHRLNLLDGDFKEVGVGQELGKYSYQGQAYNSSMVTQDFAGDSSRTFVTGVVYNDTVKNDDFFTVGEQVAGAKVSGSGATDTTGSGGGYELLYGSAGSKSIDFDLKGGTVSVGLKLGATNVKVDVVNGDEVWTDNSLTSVSKNVAEVHALGIGKVDFKGAGSSQDMVGNTAANTIKGNGGDDTIDGGHGADKLYGGSGADTFVFAKGDTSKSYGKADTIFDFSTGDGDKIDLTAWDADSTKKGHQAFDFIGSDAFGKHAGELHVVTTKTDTYVEGDTNGDGKADFSIHLAGVVNLTGNSFDL